MQWAIKSRLLASTLYQRHTHHIRLGFAALALAVVTGAGTVAQAQTLSVLYAFQGGTDGNYPYRSSVVLNTKGQLIGTTLYGGNDYNCHSGCGVIFSVDPATGKETVLRHFGKGRATGTLPCCGVVLDAQGNIYGATQNGGPNNVGTLFELTTGGQYEQLFHFKYSPETKGWYPGGLAIDQNLNLYGQTYQAGDDNACSLEGCGTVFRYSVASHKFKTLYTFNGGTDGCWAEQDWMLVDTAGNLYGTEHKCGAYGAGNVFKIDTKGKFSVLYSFGASAEDGALPLGRLAMDANGNLYGTTSGGGISSGDCSGIGGCGTVFELNPATGQETVLYRFQGLSSGDGADPLGGVIFGPGGNLYGTTQGGGIQNNTVCTWYNPNGCGIIFEVNPATGRETVVHAFAANGSEGALPSGPMAWDGGSNFYGTAQQGGSFANSPCTTQGCGTVFKLSLADPHRQASLASARNLANAVHVNTSNNGISVHRGRGS